MAVTHADLENGRRCGLTGGKAGSMVIVLCVFAGLLGFIFCLLSEFTRSEVPFSNSVFFLSKVAAISCSSFFLSS